MTKLIICCTIFFCNCTGKVTDNKITEQKKPGAQNSTVAKGLHGTWIRQNKAGFTLIEIKDTSNILYYQFTDRKAYDDTITSDRYWYYRSTAKMGYWDSSAIWIATDNFRFDYKLSGDTLLEFDKMGDQGKFIKVYTDEQKGF